MARTIVGVMGGASADANVQAKAYRLGELIAQRGWVLLNGGRDAGVMAASARGAKLAGGTVVGVLPGRDTKGASPNLDIAIVTGLGDARNVVNVLSSDVIIACRGGVGTLSEIALALKSSKPVVLLDFDIGPPFDKYRKTGQLTGVQTPEEAIEQVTALLPKPKK